MEREELEVEKATPIVTNLSGLCKGQAHGEGGGQRNRASSDFVEVEKGGSGAYISFYKHFFCAQLSIIET